MKHAVIVGASRGLGREMAARFAAAGWAVTMSGRDADSLAAAEAGIRSAVPGCPLACLASDTALPGEADRLWAFAAARFPVDVWIQNAGINQPDATLDRLADADMDRVVSVNLLGAMHGVAAAWRGMQAQGHGRIYTMEGFGSNGMMAAGMTVYGASKAALTYFTESFSRERKAGPVTVGTLSPGMMLTSFLLDPLERMEPGRKARLERIYDILADDPAEVADWLVRRVIADRSRRPRIRWLTGGKAFLRFLLSPFRTRDLVRRMRGLG